MLNRKHNRYRNLAWRSFSVRAVACLLLLASHLLPQVTHGPDAQAATKRPQPSLKFTTSSHDFGKVYRGESLTHIFQFKNVGDAPLTIQGVHAACGCTAVEVDKNRQYAPGESGSIEVKFETKDFAGSIAKSITVMSNEKLLPDRVLTLKAFVKTEFDVTPPLIDFGGVDAKEGAERTVTLKPLAGFKLQVDKLIFNDKVLDAVFAKQQENFIITVKLKPNLPPSFLKETVLVINNSKFLDELPIPIRANIRGRIEYAPTYLEFGSIAPASKGRRSITMKGQSIFEITGSRAELHVNGRKIDDATSLLTVESLPAEKDKRLVAVELHNSGKLAGSIHGKLFLETNDPGQNELTFDFYAFFR